MIARRNLLCGAYRSIINSVATVRCCTLHSLLTSITTSLVFPVGPSAKAKIPQCCLSVGIKGLPFLLSDIISDTIVMSRPILLSSLLVLLLAVLALAAPLIRQRRQLDPAMSGDLTGYGNLYDGYGNNDYGTGNMFSIQEMQGFDPNNQQQEPPGYGGYQDFGGYNDGGNN